MCTHFPRSDGEVLAGRIGIGGATLKVDLKFDLRLHPVGQSACCLPCLLHQLLCSNFLDLIFSQNRCLRVSPETSPQFL
ncbi:unnamed protein product [Brassica oleracea var. botrytis]